MIYEQVVVTDVQTLIWGNKWTWAETSGPGLNLAILGTCRQINFEAEETLFKRNSTCLRFDFQGLQETWAYRGVVDSDAIMHDLIGGGNDDYEYTPPILNRYSFPVQKLRTVTIDLRCGRKVGGDEEWLYGIVKNTARYLPSCLNSCSSLEKVHVQVDWDRSQSQWLAFLSRLIVQQLWRKKGEWEIEWVQKKYELDAELKDVVRAWTTGDTTFRFE